MTASPRPRVTIAIPLHASAPFVDVVAGNVARIPYADAEILVSDRSGRDGALDTLARRLGDDPRVRFLRAHDGAGWVDHYNALLRCARGERFMWMPHDDDFPADYLPLLDAALDARPGALLAFGRIRAIDVDGGPRADRPFLEPPFALGTLPRPVEAVRLFREWHLGIPIRGLLRRDEILRRRLWIRHEAGDQSVDQTWALAVVTAGPVVYEPRATCDKRYYPTSTHARWTARSSLGELSTIPALARYLTAARVPLGDAVPVMRVATLRSVERALWSLPAPVQRAVPARVRRAAAAWFRRDTPPTAAAPPA